MPAAAPRDARQVLEAHAICSKPELALPEQSAFGSVSFGIPRSSTIDTVGRVHIVMATDNPALPVSHGGTQHAGERDFYWITVDPDGRHPEVGTYFGSPDDDVPNAAAFAPSASP
jgi:hypothetical protein